MITEQEFKKHIYYDSLTLDIVKEWVESGGDINIKDNNGWTALMWVSREGYLDIVKVLVEKGAKASSMLEKAFNMDLQNKDGNTALILASRLDNLEIVQLLIENGANMDIQDIFGCTALMRASWYSRLEIVQLLVEKGADINIKNNNGKIALHCIRKNIKGIKIFLQLKHYSTKIKQLKRKNISFNKFILA